MGCPSPSGGVSVCSRPCPESFPLTWTIEVRFSTHDELKDGSCEPGCQYACVLANTEAEAHTVAAQMVACHENHIVITRTTTLEVQA